MGLDFILFPVPTQLSECKARVTATQQRPGQHKASCSPGLPACFAVEVFRFLPVMLQVMVKTLAYHDYKPGKEFQFLFLNGGP
jgi:hypothetical protein